VARRLGEQAMTLCAAPAYLAKRGSPRTVTDLAGHEGIFYANGRHEAAWPLAIDELAQRIPGILAAGTVEMK
jgi:DNA-binding transcriptional LysR family regulator